MGTVATLLDEHVSFRCTSVDRIGIRGYVPGLQYEGGVVKFLLNRGNFIPSPAVLNHNRERLVAELEALEEATGVPVVRFKVGQSKEDIARPFQDEALSSGRPGLVLVGKAQERTSSWLGFVDDTHPGQFGPTIPTSPGFAGPQCPTIGTSTSPTSSGDRPFSNLLLRALPALVLLQRSRVGQAPAGQGRRRVLGPRQRAAVSRTPGSPIASVPASGRVICAGSWPASWLSSPTPSPSASRRRLRVVLLLGPVRGLRHAVFDQPRRARAWFEAAIGDHLDLGRPDPSSSWSIAKCVAAPAARPQGAFLPRSSPATPPPSSRSTTSPPKRRPI